MDQPFVNTAPPDADSPAESRSNAVGTPKGPRANRALWIVVLIAVVVRLTVFTATRSWEFDTAHDHWSFAYEMGRIAGSLQAGEGFSYPLVPPRPTAWMAPVYPYIIASSFTVFGPYSAASAVFLLLMQIVISVGLCVVAYVLCHRLYGRDVSLVCASILAIYPASIHFSAQKISDATLTSCILLLSLLVASELRDHPGIPLSLLCGWILGVGVLTNPVILAVIPPLALWLAAPRPELHWTRIRDAGVMVLTALLTISPWIVRNYAVFDAFVLVKSNFGHELYLGNHETASGILDQRITGIERFARGLEGLVPDSTLSPDEERRLMQMDEVSFNRELLALGLRSIARDPARFVRLSVKRAFRYWTITRQPSNPLGWISHAFYFAALILAVYGLVSSESRLESNVLVFIPIVFVPVAYYITVVGWYRYRFAVEPLVIVLASLGITRLLAGSGTDRAHTTAAGIRS